MFGAQLASVQAAGTQTEAPKRSAQRRRPARTSQGKCLGRYTSALAAALAAALVVKIGNNKIIYKGILTALADAINDLTMFCHEQRTAAATGPARPPESNAKWKQLIAVA